MLNVFRSPVKTKPLSGALCNTSVTLYINCRRNNAVSYIGFGGLKHARKFIDSAVVVVTLTHRSSVFSYQCPDVESRRPQLMLDKDEDSASSPVNTVLSQAIESRCAEDTVRVFSATSS